MKIALITGNDREHMYVANTLCRRLELVAVIVDRGTKRPLLKRFKGKLRRYGPWGLIERGAMSLLKIVLQDSRVRRRELARVFGSDRCTAFDRSDLVTNVEGVNSPKSLSILRELKPDLLLVFGTGIVREQVLSTAQQLVLNMHTGLSPDYRGAACAFWPLHNAELDKLGATVHECTNEVDGGKIFGTARVRLKPTDGLHTVFARTVAAGADLYAQSVDDILKGQANAISQDLSRGREYKVSMRNLRAELHTRFLIRRGLIRNFVKDSDTRCES